MLDACNQVGWELQEAHQQVDTKLRYLFLKRLNYVRNITL